MELRQMEYILMIQEEKSITRAAERLFLTQSALNQQLPFCNGFLHGADITFLGFQDHMREAAVKFRINGGKHIHTPLRDQS